VPVSAAAQMKLGANFTRPAEIELRCAEAMLAVVPGMEMIKFAKNGSDVTTAAVKLARACTGRDLVACCAEHPFFSTDDWFIGATDFNAGIPQAITDLTLKFHYNDLASVKALFDAHPNRIACLILEPETTEPPRDGFLEQLREICHQHGALLIFDEMIAGFRWQIGGGEVVHGVEPDLACFGKAMANGFAVSALLGKRAVMERGGLQHNRERVFLLSTTHGAETHSLAACMATIRAYQEHDVIGHLHRAGERLREGATRAAAETGTQEHFKIAGRSCNLIFATLDARGDRSQAFRTLFLQEMIRHGVICPSFVVSFSHSDADIDRTIEAVRASLAVYRKALDEGAEKHLVGRPVKPVMRRLN
jgi:glutamate-1-semialdehyde 2,1-aminomutase